MGPGIAAQLMLSEFFLMHFTTCPLTLHLFLFQEREIVTLYFTYICSSTARSIFLGVLYGYKMVLQVIALVFAFATRKVKVKGLDDSKYIAAAIYVTSIVLAFAIITSYSLRDFVNVFATLFCTGYLIGTTVVLGLVFVPKVRTLWSCGDMKWQSLVGEGVYVTLQMHNHVFTHLISIGHQQYLPRHSDSLL